ncbi:hypothetical protein NN761_05315 [Bacteroides clarus]|uniref:hypothetical protein n=1 Tax=Bacteroides clarus TaxID=626929 RepID=UPI0021015141|nr:hypothetical protein [Bacteroides clarus]MCQ1544986.1 hypothetical protein [Bacteroides clarus]
MTIKEIVEKVSRGDLTPVEVYEDIIRDWSEEKKDSLQLSLLAIHIQGGRNLTNHKAKNCGNCYSYLERRWQEEQRIEQSPKHEQESTERNILIDEGTEQNIITNNTPALDCLFRGVSKGMKGKFYDFCSTSEQKQIFINSSNVIYLLKMITRCNITEKLHDNGRTIAQLYNELETLGLLHGGKGYDTIKKACNNKKNSPSAEICSAWDEHSKKV